MDTLNQKLDAVWDKAGPVGDKAPETNARYIPQATGRDYGWGIFDRKRDRFLNNEDIRKLPLASLRDEQLSVN